MADQDGGHSKMITQLLRHVTSYPHDADVKGDTFRHTIYPPNLVAIVLYSRIYGGGGGGGIRPPGRKNTKKKPGLNRVNDWLQGKQNCKVSH